MSLVDAAPRLTVLPRRPSISHLWPWRAARSGLKMGCGCPPMSLPLGPLRPSISRALGAALWALHCCFEQCATRRCMSGWRWETFVASPSWRWGEAGGSRSSGVAEGGWEQPRQSWVGSVLPDGPGPVSETGRYTRGTGAFTPLQATPALIRRMWAGWRCVPAPHFGRGTPGSVLLAWAGRPR